MNSQGSRGFERLTGRVARLPLLVATVFGVAFAALTAVVAVNPAPLPFDKPISDAVQGCSCGATEWFNSLVAALGGTIEVAAAVAVVLLVFLFKRAATPFALFSVIYALVYNGVDFTLKRPRPTELAHTTPHLGAYSFPSGHVAFFIWLGVLAMLFLVRPLPGVIRIACGAVVVAIVAAAGLSRIYVGAHWTSDVLGGMFLGVAWMSLSLSFGRLTDPVLGRHR